MTEQTNYQDFFREEIYGKFVDYLIGKFGNAVCVAMLDDEPLFTKKGVNLSFRRHFNRFLASNPKIEKVFAENGGKTFSVKNFVNERLRFPVNVNDDDLMVRESLRLPKLQPAMDKSEIPRASKMIKNSAAPMKNQILKSDWKSRNFLVPEKLILHFKRGYAMHIGKTTQTFMIENREQVNSLIFDVFENKVAYAIIGKERLTLVKHANPTKKQKTLPGTLQQ